MPSDFFATQEQRAARSFAHGEQRRSGASRLDRDIRRVQGWETHGSKRAEASKSAALASLQQARSALQRAEALPPPAAAISAAKQRRKARGDWVQAGADLTTATIELMRMVARPVAEAIEENMIPLAEYAIAGWPVKSGRSRDALQVHVRATSEEVTTSFINDVAYVMYIKRGTHSRYSATADTPENLRQGRPAWVDLARRPFRGMADTIADDIARKFGRIK